MNGTNSGYHFYHPLNECWRLWYFSNYSKLSSEPPPWRPTLGTVLHEYEAEYYRSKKVKPFKDTMTRYKDLFAPDKYVEALDDATAMLQVWLNTWSEHDNEHWTVIDVEKDLSASLEGFNVTGRLDLLVHDKETERLLIVDHKHTFSSINSTIQRATFDDQGACYWWLAEENNLNPGGFLVDVLYKNRSVVKAERSNPLYINKDRLKQFKSGLLFRIERVNLIAESLEKDGDPFYYCPKTPGSHCAWCEYKDICSQNIKPDYIPIGYRRKE